MKQSECKQADITIKPDPRTVSVFLDSKLILKTNNALALKENGYPIVHYFPRGELDDALITTSDHQTYCPYKGYAHYFNLKSVSDVAQNSVWYYPVPCPLVEKIRDHVSFWGEAISIEVDDES